MGSIRIKKLHNLSLVIYTFFQDFIGLFIAQRCTQARKNNNLQLRRFAIIKDQLIPTPPLFRLIQNESGTDWKEMYRVFNMGHRLEIYTDQASAQAMIECAKELQIDAQIIGRVEASDKKQVTISGEHGTFHYE